MWKPVRELHYRIAAALRADDGRESPMHLCVQVGSLTHLSSSGHTTLPWETGDFGVSSPKRDAIKPPCINRERP